MKIRTSRTICLMLAAISGATLLAGCAAVGPNYRKPGVSTGAGWTQPTDNALDTAVLSRWWDKLGDPELARLVEISLKQNLDVRQAAARIASARAALAGAEAAGQPVVAANGSIRAQRVSINSPEYNPQRSPDQTVFDTGFDASWEIDLFGSVRRQRESASARLEASEVDAAGVRLGVAAEVGRTYLGLRGFQRELAARRESVKTLGRILELVNVRKAAGDTSQFEVDKAQARFEQARVAIPALESRIRASALALGLLLGNLPESELRLADETPSEIVLNPVPVGERADILRRRPDVISAERRLAAATAEIGIATAEKFPKLTLTAGAGFRALTGSDFLDWDSRRGSTAPLISWRVLDGGRVKAEINAAEARQEVAALEYEKAVLGAVSDAERALSQYGHGLRVVDVQRSALKSLDATAQSAKRRYELGDTSITEWLDAQRELSDGQALLAQATNASSADLVSLYKALGGGWDPPGPVGPR